MHQVHKETDSLTNFKRDTTEFLDRLEESGEPVLLTVHGKAKLVVQDATSYQRLLESIDRQESIKGIRQGLDEMKAGKGRPADEVFERIRRRFKLPRAKQSR